jgi:hypothetical protein
MSLHVMYADHRDPSRECVCLRVAHADEQRAHQAGCVRHRDGVDGVDVVATGIA